MVALVGAGGKTTLMFALAHALVGMGYCVLTTTSTHIFPPTAQQSPLLVLASDNTAPALNAKLLHTHRHITLAQGLAHTGKLQGISSLHVDTLAAAHMADYILVEADGAAQHPLKAPAPHEPAVPRSTTLCMAVLGLDAVGQNFDQAVHRAPLAAALCAVSEQHCIQPEHLAHLALHPQGLFRTTPVEAQRIVVCNKADVSDKTYGPNSAPPAHAVACTARRAGLVHYPHAACPWFISSARQGWATALLA